MAVNSGQSVHIFSAQVMHSHFNDQVHTSPHFSLAKLLPCQQVSAVQVSPRTISVTYHLTGLVHSVDVDFLIDGICVTKVTIMISDIQVVY